MYKAGLTRPGYTNDDWNHGNDKFVNKRVDLFASLGGHRSHLAANGDYVSNGRAQYFINIYSNLVFMFPSVNTGTYLVAEITTRSFVKLDYIEKAVVIFGSIDNDEKQDEWREMMLDQYEIDVANSFFKSVMLFKSDGKYKSVS